MINAIRINIINKPDTITISITPVLNDQPLRIYFSWPLSAVRNTVLHRLLVPELLGSDDWQPSTAYRNEDHQL